MIETQPRQEPQQATRRGIVDCDVHPSPRGADEIRGYMPMPWRDRYSGGGRGFFGNPVHGARLDSSPPAHQAAPLCLGSVQGMLLPGKPGEYTWARDGEILRCPWHGWEFDLLTGRSVLNPHKTRVRTYEVRVETESDDPAVETYAVSVEDGLVVLHT